MARKYGPVMYLKMGAHGMVVASTPDAARAFLRTLDLNFANRPKDSGPTHLAYDTQNLVFADYGPRWMLLRKLSNTHMLGEKALEDLSRSRSLELGHMLRDMCESSRRGELVVVPEILMFAKANMIGQAILNRRVFVTKGSESNEFRDIVVELMTTTGYVNIGDFVPSIAWMDLQGIVKGMKVLQEKIDKVLTKMVTEHLETTHERKGKPDSLDVLLQYQEKGDVKLSLIHIKALLSDLFTAGTDPSTSVIEWALAEMLKKPTVLKKVQDEMDQVISLNRRLKESDMPKLPYLKSICKETLRMHPSTPLNVPRLSAEACEVDGYYIPKNTRLNVNIWAIGRDPNVWENPLEFRPERFMEEKNANIDPRGNDFELIPFGAGRRVCAGRRLGVLIVEYMLGTLVHAFDWKLPNGTKDLDMEEAFGIALRKAVPLSAVVTPRLEESAYA